PLTREEKEVVANLRGLGSAYHVPDWVEYLRVKNSEGKTWFGFGIEDNLSNVRLRFFKPRPGLAKELGFRVDGKVGSTIRTISRKMDTVTIVEGFTDAIRLDQRRTDIIILNGASNSSHIKEEMLRNYKHVCVATDADLAGEKAYLKIKEICPKARRVRWDGLAKDIDEALKNGFRLYLARG
ncbi:MAG: hypothetical protein C0170_05810, partial [Hydrogenobaculum sp.]